MPDDAAWQMQAMEPPDYTGQFNTLLSAADEQRFQKDYPDPNDNFDYDMRGAWKSGASRAGNGHLPDTFKKPNHPTFSTQSQYNGVGGMTGGQWVRQGKSWAYQPSATNLQMHGPNGLKDYFQQTEPDSQLLMSPLTVGRADGGAVSGFSFDEARDMTPVYEAAGRENGVDPDLLRAQTHVESNDNDYAVSPQGARGRSQFIPSTARAMGLTDPTDPVQSIHAQARLMRQNFDQFGRPDLAIAAYHGGPNTSQWGPRTRDYVDKVTQAYAARKAGQQQSVPQGFSFEEAQQPAAGFSFEEAQQPTMPQVPEEGLPMSKAQSLKLLPMAKTEAGAPLGSTQAQPEDTSDSFGWPAAAGPTLVDRLRNASAGNTAPEIAAEQGMVPEPVQSAPMLRERLGKVATAAGEAYGSEPLGMSAQFEQAMQKAGILPTEGGGPQPLKRVNEALMRPFMTGLDLVARGGMAGLTAAEEGLVQAGESIGMPEAGRDAAALLEYYVTNSMASPHGMPRPSMADAARYARDRLQTARMPEAAAAAADMTAAPAAAMAPAPTTAPAPRMEQTALDELPTIDVHAKPVAPTAPEPPADIAAQIRAMADPANPKDAVFVAAGNEAAIPAQLPYGVAPIRRPEGTLLTHNRDKAVAFRDAETLDEGTLAGILGYPETKSEAVASGNPQVVQGTDRAGNVVTESVASPEGVPAAQEMAGQQASDVRTITPLEALQRRGASRETPTGTEPLPPPEPPNAAPPVASVPRQPVDAVTALIDAGGVKDPRGDLEAIGADESRHRFAGRFLSRLINNDTGMSPNAAREFLRDNGYVTQEQGLDDRIVHDVAESHARGNPTYRHSDLSDQWEDAQNRAAQAEWDRYQQEIHQNATLAAEAGVRLSPEELEHSAQLSVQGLHPEEAIRQAARASDAERGFYARRAPKPPAAGAPLFGEAAPEPKPKAEPEPTIRNDPRQVDMFGRNDAAVQAQAARDQAGPRGGQLPADQGLFGTKAEEGPGLFARREEEPRVPLYSAVSRATDGLKQAKGTGEQMLAQITRTPGVKPEEIKWLGLDNWLRGQKSVTKQQIADYVRANALDVREVTKGAVSETPVTRFHVVDQGGNQRGDFATRAEAESYFAHSMLIDPAHSWIAEHEDVATSGEPAKFNRSPLVLPGGENYRELLITLPGKVWDRDALDAQIKGLLKDWPNDLKTARDPAEQPRLDALLAEWESNQRRGETPYRTPHWEEPNVLAHVRFNERTSPDGKRTLLVEEVQSDWHQAGRKQGYKGERPPEQVNFSTWGAQHGLSHDDVMRIWDAQRPQAPPLSEADNALWQKWVDDRDATIEANAKYNSAIPDAPFKTTWPQLVMKRMIKYAADNGFDRVAWTPGDVQAARYDLSKQIKALHYDKTADGNYLLAPETHEGREVPVNNGLPIAADKLADYVGKDVADKIIKGEGEGTTGGIKTLSGLDLKVGGEGMRGFYDKMLPNEVQKIVGKYSGKVGKSEIGTNNPGFDVVAGSHVYGTFGTKERAEQAVAEIARSIGADPNELRVRANPIDTQPVHSVDLTPELRQSVQNEGLPLFARRSDGTGGTIDPEARTRLTDAAQRMMRSAGLPNDIGFRLVDRITDAAGNSADAHYTRSMISLALDTKPEDMAAKLFHEVVHAAMDPKLGLLDDAQKATLFRAADRWLNRAGNRERLTEMGYGPAELREEAVARMGEEALARGIQPPVAYQRIINFLNRIGNFLRGQGFRTADDVFDSLMSRGAAPGAAGTGEGEAFARRPQPGLQVTTPQQAQEVLADKKGIAKAAGEIRAAFAPTSMGGAKPMEYQLRAHNSRSAQAFDQSFHALEKVRAAVDKLSKDDQVAFTDRMEAGERQPTPQLQAVSDALREQLDGWAKRIQGLGKGYLANAIENYMGHIWGNYAEWAARLPTDMAQSEMESRARSAGMRRQPLRGSGNFLKQRNFPTQREGIEAGLVPVTYNPVDLQLIKLHEMQKFYHGTVLADKLKESGLAKWVPAAMEAEREAQLQGWQKLDDTIFRPRIMGAQNEAGFGRLEPGNYWAPESPARVFNNYMSQGFHGQSSIYDALRRGNNALNTLQLGFSGFHATFVTADTAISKVALGLQQVSQGHPVRGVGNILFGAAAPASVIQTVFKGSKLRKAWLDPESATPEMRQILSALQAGGGRVSMPRFYQTSASGAFFHGLTDLKNPAGAFHSAVQMFRDSPSVFDKAVMVPLRLAGRVIDTINQPLMGALVPRAKLGVFADMAQNWLRDHPEATQEQLAAASTKFMDSVDNRLGQLNYDNLFWNKVGKDIAFITTRSVGWNLGTVREIGGAFVDSGSVIKDIARGRTPELTTRMAYTMALPVVTAEIGAVLTYLATGQAPQSLLDYFYPPTGNSDQSGQAERRSIPGYMKDVIAFSQDWQQTVLNKTAPLLDTIQELWKNRDYYGGIIYDPERDKGPAQAYGDYLINQTTPFSLRAWNKLHGEGAPSLDQSLAFWGFQPAPKSITQPERGEAFRQRENARAYRKRMREPGRVDILNAPPP